MRARLQNVRAGVEHAIVREGVGFINLNARVNTHAASWTEWRIIGFYDVSLQTFSV